jgi:hypothetical protein
MDEFTKFSPKMECQKYIGGKEEREEIRDEIIKHIRTQPKAERVRFEI